MIKKNMLNNADVAFIDVRAFENTIRIFDYFGTCYTGIRNTNRVAKVLKNRFPMYTIWVEKFTTFEIDIEEDLNSLQSTTCMLTFAEWQKWLMKVRESETKC